MIAAAHSRTVSVAPDAPFVTIFVRHSADCRFRGDEFHKTCKCRKHLRWSYGGRQYRQSARTRSWAIAEQTKKKIEAQFEMPGSRQPSGAVRVQEETRNTIERAIELFISDKRSAGVQGGVLKKYERELQ